MTRVGRRAAELLSSAWKWLTRDPDDRADPFLNLAKRLAIVLAPLAAIAAVLAFVVDARSDKSDVSPADAQTASAVPVPSSDAGSSTTALDTANTPSTSPSSTSAEEPIESESLEILEVEFGEEAVDVPVDKESIGYASVLAFGTEESNLAAGALPIVVTLRNSTDRPLVLNNLRMTVESQDPMPLCVQLGGEVGPSYNYDFKYVENEIPWSGVRKQNFEVRPNSTDALSVTLGPYFTTENVDLSARAVVFSLVADTPGGGEIELVRGVHLDSPGTVDPQALLEYTIADIGEAGLSSQMVVDCVKNGTSLVQNLRERGSVASGGIEHPDLVAFEAYYKLLGESNP